MRVVVFERDLSTSRWLEAVLRARGHTVTLSRDPEGAWRALEDESPHLLILDWAGEGGAALCRRVRASMPAPLILASVLSDEPSELEAAVEAGADELLQKSADAGQVNARLVVAERRARQRSQWEGLGEDLRRQQARLESALRESEERYSLAALAANDGLWDWNLKTDEIRVSPRWKAMLGLDHEEVGRGALEWVSRIHPEDLERVKAKVAAHLSGRVPLFEDEHRMRHKSGSYRWVFARAFAARDSDGRATHLAGALMDLTERRAHDPLTELPNRSIFEERLSRAIGRPRGGPEGGPAVLFIDLDRFKEVNDRRGHIVGDQLLAAVARRLENCLRPGDLVSRFGGDEFAILLELANVGGATHVAERILDELSASFPVIGHEVRAWASIGIALVTSDDVTVASVLHDADTAMYRAKASGGNRFEVFDEAMRSRVRARSQLDRDLRRGLEGGEFRLYYLPTLTLRSGRLAGFDAQLKWQHPDRGLLAPEAFLHPAEEPELTRILDAWAVRAACQEIARWHARVPSAPSIPVSVDVSEEMLTAPGFPRELSALLEEYRLPGRSLRLEIREEWLASGGDLQNALLALRGLGIGLALDAFGRGPTSLPALARLRPAIVKIDSHRFSGLEPRDGDSGILRALLAVAQSFGGRAVATSVENAAEAERLRELGLWAGQGGAFSPPVTGEAAAEMVAGALPRGADRSMNAAQDQARSRAVGGAA